MNILYTQSFESWILLCIPLLFTIDTQATNPCLGYFSFLILFSQKTDKKYLILFRFGSKTDGQNGESESVTWSRRAWRGISRAVGARSWTGLRGTTAFTAAIQRTIIGRRSRLLPLPLKTYRGASTASTWTHW